MRPLPGGRGAKYGTDSDIVQRESYDERSTRIHSASGWVFAITGDPYSIMASSAMTANRLRLAPVPVSSREYLLDEARIAVTLLDAGSIIKCAIYRYIGETKGFRKVSGTDAEFSGTTTGQKTYSLKKTVRLDANVRYFIGANSTSVVVRVLRFQVSTGACIAGSYFDCSASADMPDSLSTSQMTVDSTLTIPLVVYLSKEASGVM